MDLPRERFRNSAFADSDLLFAALFPAALSSIPQAKDTQEERYLAVKESLQAQLGPLLGAQPHDLPFTLKRTQSTLPSAGDGVALVGTAAAGSVVAMYAGVVYSPSDLALLHTLQPHLFGENDYLITRSDEYIVDGKPSGESAKVYQMISSGYKGFSCSPLGLGQIINHSRAKANVVQFDVEFDPGLTQTHRSSIPVFTFSAPAASTQPQRGVVFVALRELKDEELFFDYRLRPAKDRPMPTWALE